MTKRTMDPLAKARWVADRVTEPLDSTCRDWPWATSDVGYGQFWSAPDQRVLYVHRTVLEAVSPWHPPLGYQALHSCDRPVCAARWHLRWGSPLANSADTYSRGRERGTGPGEQNNASRLTAEQVAEIRDRYVPGRGPHVRGNAVALAAEFGISRAHVVAIAARKTWVAA